MGCYLEPSVRAENEQIDTIIDLDRLEVLSILRDVQENSKPDGYKVDLSSDPYTDRHLI